ncbi:MAG: hypothetical protein L3J01_04160 [Thiomicrorhabdus sp.]|nr:hypothetical protein [Thiomicrorhabdus sp.]
MLEASIPRLYAEADDDNCTNEGLDDLLSEMGVLKDDCLWTLVEGYDAVECVLMREDDNGQRFEVEHFRNKIEAKLRLHELSAGGHKQFFWVESNNREQNAAEQPATRL